MNGTREFSEANADRGKELKVLAAFAAVFACLFYLPVGLPRFDNALKEGLELTKWYAQEHVLLCLVPALFIAGGISVFINQASVMRYLGPKASKPLAYGVASVSGAILAVCSCTVLPLFGGIWMRGAGLGPIPIMKTPLKIIIVLAVTIAAVGAAALKKAKAPTQAGTTAQSATAANASVETPSAKPAPAVATKLPKLLDLGAGKCIPCKMMAPVLEGLKKEYAGRMDVEFIDVWQNPDAGQKYGIEMIPTQIFYDANGKELFRHTGFFGKEDILGKWKELGVGVSGGKAPALVVREEAVKPDTRPRDQVCFMCDGDVDPKSRTVVNGQSEQRVLCSPHCYFIYFSSIVGADPKAEEAKVSVTDWAGGNLVPAASAAYLYGMDAKGRPTIKAFADIRGKRHA